MHLRDYSDYEQEANKIRSENAELLDGFKAWLAESGLKEKTVNKHAGNVSFYINEFFNWFFPRKAMWSSVASTKETVAGLKKFYGYLVDAGTVETGDYQEFLAEVKREMPEWLDHYRNLEEW
jgi:uncharacterized protein YneR